MAKLSGTRGSMGRAGDQKLIFTEQGPNGFSTTNTKLPQTLLPTLCNLKPRSRSGKSTELPMILSLLVRVLYYYPVSCSLSIDAWYNIIHNVHPIW